MELHLQLNDTYFVLIKEELYEITWHLSNTAATLFLYNSSDRTALSKVGDRYFNAWFNNVNGEHFLFCI